jgi:glycosyltransferase involved in cell wall biosynthesis
MIERKVLVVTFVGLVRDSGGPASVAIGMARHLHERGRLLGVVCPSFDRDEVGLPAELIYSPPHPIFQKLLIRILGFTSRFAGLNERRLRESVFDYFLSKSKRLRSAEAVLFLKPAFPRSASCSASRGIPSFVWASILHPRFNRNEVLEEREIWNAEGGFAYTDEKRIGNLEKFFRSVDHVLVGSRVARQSFVTGGVEEEKLHLLAGTFAIDCDRFAPEEGNRGDRVFRALHVSQMNLIKGVGYLLDAWSKLQLDSAELVLVGTMEAGVKGIYERIAPPHTRIEGFIDDLSPYYGEADVFISPSVADLHPYTVLEAMASGIAVIVSNRCGISEVVDQGVNGFVYPYDDADSLAEHIRWCYDHPEELIQMGIAARESALLCERSHFAGKVIAEMDRCID